MTERIESTPFPGQTGEVERNSILVYGKVQGVGYRKFTAAHAASLNLGGFCRNLVSGEVEIEVEGPSVNIAQLIDRLRQGPPRGKVDRLVVLPMPPKNESIFQIRLD